MSKNKQTQHILIVEDEESLAIGLEYNLSHEGYQVTRVPDGQQALNEINTIPFDLIILDVMLPFLDGFEVAKKIREHFPQMPILMLTARTAAKDRIQGLESGADDYLTKPFHLKELLLRVKGMLRRKQWYQEIPMYDTIVTFGENEIDFENMRAKHGKKSFILTPHEALVMKYIIHHQGKIVTRKELLENVWHVHAEVETRTIDNFIMRLRKYFETNPAKPAYIVSVRGVGYIFSPPEKQ